MKQWIAHCQTCSWTGVRRREEDSPKQEKAAHLNKHPEHKVRVLVTGEDDSPPPSFAPLNLKK